MVNHLVEMLLAAARVRGLAAIQGDLRPTGTELFAAVRADGGLTGNQAQVLQRLYQMRNELQHASPGVDATEVLDHIELLQRTLGRFAKSYIEWLGHNGISLIT